MDSKNKTGSYGYPDPFNEAGSRGGKDPNVPDTTGDDLYYGGYDEIMKMHTTATGPLIMTPNSEEAHATMGGPAAGEPNPANMKGHGGSK